MYHDPAPIAPAIAQAHPGSAVSDGVGLAGLAGIGAWVLVAKQWHLDGPFSALVALAACAVPMLLWSLRVDRVHRAPTTGIDWGRARPLAETLDVSLVKLAGYWLTWAGIALLYATLRFYWQGDFAFAMWCLGQAAPVLFVLSVPYVLWLDRHLVEPRDGAWALGAWATGQRGVAPELVPGHLRAWGVKAFFLAFMLAVTPAGFGQLIRADWHAALGDPVALAQLLVTAMFVVDVAFATVGYMLTLRPLDSHIRSANPHAAAWMAALICYPPFILMSAGGPLDYHPGTSDWVHWLREWPLVQVATGAVLVGLTAVYAWATVAFGLRFSNLTHRGILTHGPYAWVRHPAYLSKNLFWWLSTLPFLTTGSWEDAVRATVLLGVVSGVYYWRAKTEEWHLGADPAYAAYSAWIARFGPVGRLRSSLRRRRG
jgi:protein-S-isoprenylcysteine O-methyltransferase Ste14